MWTIQEHKQVEKALAEAPPQVVEKYEVWKNVVRHSGPAGLRQVKGFHDEKLKGKLSAYRSSRLNQDWRVMYQVEGEQLNVKVERISNHDYSA